MRLGSLQALRGIACLLVLGVHVAEWEQYRCKSTSVCLAHSLEFFGYIGVDLFFVLSGFVITWISYRRLGDRSQIGPFVKRRAGRVLPLYWLAWPLAALINIRVLRYPVAVNWTWFWGNVAIAPGTTDALMIPQAWSLAFELIFYGVFTAFFVVPRGAFLPALALLSCAIVIGVGAGVVPTGPLKLLDPLVLEFLMGCFAAALLRHDRGLRWGRLALLVGGIGFVLSALGEWSGRLHTRDHSLERVLSFGGSCAAIVFGAVACERTGRWLMPRWLQTVGDASYSIYLSHVAVMEFIQHSLRHMSHELAPHLVYLVILIAGTLAAGFELHVQVERRLMGWRSAERSVPAERAVPLRRAA
jgi:exopolysaccharide production protein ExoZ